MNILVLGSGGREHALANALKSKNNHVYIYPGNAGIFTDSDIMKTSIEKMNESEVLEFVKSENIELVVIGPENLLADGYADFLRSHGVRVFGPSKEAARLESSKIFSKELMKKWNIPTADFHIAETYEEAVEFINSDTFSLDEGIVLKADGLAAGKGVVVTFSKDEALSTAYDFMKNENISVKTNRLLIEKCLKGKELSAFALCDGQNFFYLGTACDYKRLKDGDEGPNTGGMGCYTPRQWPGQDVENKIKSQVIDPILKALTELGHPFIGTLFCGLMIKNDEVNVIEFNVRFGDPETQTILPLIDGDLSEILYLAATGSLKSLKSEFKLKDLFSVHLVKSSEGYPSIDGTKMNLENTILGSIEPDEFNKLFYAGVKEKDNKLVNSGGRVFGITALAKTLEEARESAYQNLGKVTFEGEHYRTDIAKV